MLSHDHLLRLHAVAIHETEHVDAVGGVDVDVGAAVDAFATDDAAVLVDHLQCGLGSWACRSIVDDPVAIAIEGKGP